MHAGNTGRSHDTSCPALRCDASPNEFCYASTVCRAAIRILHKTEGARQGRPEVPGKTPNGLSTDLYPIGSTIEVFPFVGEYTEAGNLFLSASASDEYCSSLHMLLLCRPVWLFSHCHMAVF